MYRRNPVNYAAVFSPESGATPVFRPEALFGDVEGLAFPRTGAFLDAAADGVRILTDAPFPEESNVFLELSPADPDRRRDTVVLRGRIAGVSPADSGAYVMRVRVNLPVIETSSPAPAQRLPARPAPTALPRASADAGGPAAPVLRRRAGRKAAALAALLLLLLLLGGTALLFEPPRSARGLSRGEVDIHPEIPADSPLDGYGLPAFASGPSAFGETVPFEFRMAYTAPPPAMGSLWERTGAAPIRLEPGEFLMAALEMRGEPDSTGSAGGFQALIVVSGLWQPVGEGHGDEIRAAAGSPATDDVVPTPAGDLPPAEWVEPVEDPSRVRIEISKGLFLMTVFVDDLPVYRFPVGLGAGDSTPEGRFVVVNKLRDPDWHNRGELVPAGDPRNPLGASWMGLGEGARRTPYGIHPTNEPESIRRPLSRGCIRMRPEDAERLFRLCPPGAEVCIGC